MNKAMKILIIAVLAVVVAVVIGLKEKNRQAVEETLTETENKSLSEADSSSTVTESDIEQNLPKLLDLGADKCIPCKMLAPILEEIKEEYKGKLEVVFIDVWKKPEQADKYNVNIIPTQIFYNSSGNELFRHEGFISKEDILVKFNDLGIDIQK